uniref:GG14019 n=1 Tax=Drosophila erecta TaxID=7220 RepID=B3P2W6_DROER
MCWAGQEFIAAQSYVNTGHNKTKASTNGCSNGNGEEAAAARLCFGNFLLSSKCATNTGQEPTPSPRLIMPPPQNAQPEQQEPTSNNRRPTTNTQQLEQLERLEELEEVRP